MSEEKNDQQLCTCPGEYQSGDESRHGRIVGATFGTRTVEYSVVGNEAIFEGDIVLGTVDEVSAAPTGLEGIGITGQQFRWPQGVIPFRIDSGLANQQRVHDAIAHWEANTILRFRTRTTESDFITFRSGGGCSSHVGRQGGQQFITLGSGCSTGNTIHEMGHAIGLWHEQSREDRDNFVTIDFSNVEAAKRHNFNQHVTDGDDIGQYDYGSIMHYSAFAFAIDSSRPTVLAPVPIGQRTGLSAGDMRAVATLYPVTLRLVSLECVRQEDFTGTDEPYLRVDGNRVWGPVNLGAGQTVDLRGVSPFAIRPRVAIDLFDEDFPDDDDHLGRTFARHGQAGQGGQTHTFTGDGAKYHLKYEVHRPQ